MYKHFFGLRENPFNVNPDPRFLFLTPQTRDALEALSSAIQTRKGLMLLTGEVGTGKTTLINRLLDWLHQQQIHTAFVFNPHLETRHLFDFILADFGVPLTPLTNSNPLMRLNQRLLECYCANENAVLIVDEAQGLSLALLEEIRLLVNLETPHEKLLQVVLVGQPELEETLKRNELRQLRQRIALHCKTAPLTCDQTCAYIQTRLRTAGSNGKPIFASEAISALHFYARGIPRVINLLGEHSLVNAYADNVQPVPVSIVDKVAHEFQFDDVKRPIFPMDFGHDADVQSISAQSTFANVPGCLPSAAEPAWEAQPTRGITHASVPVVVAKPATISHCQSGMPTLALEGASERISTSDTIGDAVQEETERLLDATEFTSEDAFRLLSEVVLRSQATTSQALLRAIEPGVDFTHSVASSRRSASRPETSAHRPITNGITSQTSQGTGANQSWKSVVRPIDGSVLRKTGWSLIASSLNQTRMLSTLSQWWRPVANAVQRMCRKWPVGRDGWSPVAFPRMTASLIRWLRQPWG